VLKSFKVELSDCQFCVESVFLRHHRGSVDIAKAKALGFLLLLLLVFEVTTGIGELCGDRCSNTFGSHHLSADLCEYLGLRLRLCGNTHDIRK
jgi:hypothetical protein